MYKPPDVHIANCTNRHLYKATSLVPSVFVGSDGEDTAPRVGELF